MSAKRTRVSDKYRNPPAAVPKVYSEAEIKARWKKKTGQIETLANHIQSLRYNITKDLQSDDEKVFLTAICLYTILCTGERVGNETSANAGHRGVTGFLKSQVTTDGNRVTFRYTGKSGVKQEKVVTDEKLANNIRKALKMSDSKYLFCTSEGFCIKADRVNRYLKDFDVTAKDIRGYSANRWIIERLKANDIPKEEKERKKLFLKVATDIAKKVGHSRSMLRSSYLLPDLESLYIEKGKIVNIKDGNSYSHGGVLDNKKKVSGGKISRTPAPEVDKIHGSKVNEKGSSKNISSAKEIKFNVKTLIAIQDKVKEHNERHTEKKVTLASAKAVVRRGMGAYSSSHRPTISGGKPNSRVAWGLARLNAFLYKIVHGRSKSGNYTQDDDLINELGYKVKKFEDGGKVSGREIVYRGEPIGSKPLAMQYVWVSPDIEIAREYGKPMKYTIPRNLNCLVVKNKDRRGYTNLFKNSVAQFSGKSDDNDTYESYAYEPPTEFIEFLKGKGYDGLTNDNHSILLFDKSVIEKFSEGGEVPITVQVIKENHPEIISAYKDWIAQLSKYPSHAGNYDKLHADKIKETRLKNKFREACEKSGLDWVKVLPKLSLAKDSDFEDGGQVSESATVKESLTVQKENVEIAEQNEEAQMYIDILSEHPHLEAYQKYKVILKYKFGIDFDKIYKDEELIKNASLSDIKHKKDFMAWDNYCKYAVEIWKLRGFENSWPIGVDKEINIEQATEVGKELGFTVKFKEYTGEGNIAYHMSEEITMPAVLDINTFIHEVGHNWQWHNRYDGLAMFLENASSLYGVPNGASNEVFAENFMAYFSDPKWMKKNLPEVYDELDKVIDDETKCVINALINKEFAEGGNVESNVSTVAENATVETEATIQLPELNCDFETLQRVLSLQGYEIVEKQEPVINLFGDLEDTKEINLFA